MLHTLASLRTRARIRADQDSSTFPTDTQYDYLLNEAAKDVWMDLLGAGMPYGVGFGGNAALSQALQANTGFLSISADNSANDIAAITGVYMRDGGAYKELKVLPADRRADMLLATGTPTYYRIEHTQSGAKVYLYPVPPDGGSYRVDVITTLVTMDVNTGWSGPARSDELIVLRAAMKACRKEGNDQGAQFLAQEYAELWEKTMRMVQWFRKDAELIRDVQPLMPARDGYDYDV